MIKYTPYQKAVPLSFFRELRLTPPNRQCEIQCFEKCLTRDSLSEFLYDAIYFTEDEQIVHDADVEIVRCNHSPLVYGSTISNMVGYTVTRCLQLLNRCEAICVYRYTLGLDPLPPRFYPNLFEGTLIYHLPKQDDETNEEYYARAGK